jgi:UDP-N-acetylmuramate dehydrogenase
MTSTTDAALAILRDACGDRVRADVPMAPLTTFRIGGPAAIFFEPDSTEDLHAVAKAVARTGVAVAIVGKGSNVLVADEGFDGVVLRLGRGFRWSARAGDTVSAGAAMPLPALAGVAQQHGLAGLGFGVAIPASLGGAVRMNAGAHDGQMADVVSTVDIFELGSDRTRTLGADEVGFAYRSTALQSGAVVVAAALHLRPGDPAEIRASMDAARTWRRDQARELHRDGVRRDRRRCPGAHRAGARGRQPCERDRPANGGPHDRRPRCLNRNPRPTGPCVAGACWRSPCSCRSRSPWRRGRSPTRRSSTPSTSAWRVR